MRAAAIQSYGPPDVLQIMELANPSAGNGQVRIRVKSAGIQPFDTAVRRGSWAPVGMNIAFPQILGNEFAGIVDQVGEGSTEFSIGDEVLGWAVLACYAEYVVVGVDQIVRKPKEMSWEEAGVLSASGQTAYTALQELNVSEGDTVLIHGAAGGVGSFAVQLARAWGAEVIGTSSERNHKYLRSLGAIPTVYGDGLIKRVHVLSPQGVDAALDAAGEEALRASVALVSNKDRIGTIVSFELGNQLGVRMIRSQRSKERLAELVELYTEDKIGIFVRKVFSLENVADAHREVETGHGKGKVAIVIN